VGLVASYRRAITALVRAAGDATGARHERSLGRALTFMRERLAQPLTLPQVARVAGFAPRYFSELLRRDHGVAFEAYLHRLRLEHSRHLLDATELCVGRVAQRAGFRSRTHFQRAFKAFTGQTPLRYRAAAPAARS
jgi:transcriptional regulator GlxA family with amidase domain